MRVADDAAELEREQRVRPLQLGLAPVGPLEQPERAQRLAHQVVDVVGPDQPTGRLTDGVGDLGDRAPSVDGEQHLVQQRGELQDLPVRPAGEGRGLPVARPRHLAEQLQTGRPDEDLRLGCGAGRHPRGVTA